MGSRNDPEGFSLGRMDFQLISLESQKMNIFVWVHLGGVKYITITNKAKMIMFMKGFVCEKLS